MGKIISSMLSGAPFFSDPLGTLKNSLVDILGFNIEIWQIILVGVLVVALIVALIVALVKPRKANKERVRQFVENEENAYKIRKQLSEKQREINEIRHTLNKRQFEYNRAVKKVKDDYNEAHSREDREFFVATEKLGAMNENLRDLSVKLKKNPKGETLAALQAEFDKADAEHSAFADKYSALRIEKCKRDEEYKNELKKLEDEFAFVKDDYEADIAERTKEIKKLEAELDKLESSKIRISSKDADAILEEFRKQEELDKQARLKQAEDDVEKAKGEYIDAQNLRIQYERDRIEAVNSAKEDSLRKATLETARKETEAKVRYGTPSAHPADDEEAEQISDIIKKSDDEKVAREYIEAVQAESDLEEPVYIADERADNAAVGEATENEITATDSSAENSEINEIGDNGETAVPEYQPNAIDALEELEQGMGDVDRKNREEVVSEVAEVEEAAEEAVRDDSASTTESAQTADTDSVQEYNPALSLDETAAEENSVAESETIVEEPSDRENTAEETAVSEENEEKAADEVVSEENEPVATEEIVEDNAEKPEQTEIDENKLEETATDTAADDKAEVAAEESAAAESRYEAEETYKAEAEPVEEEATPQAEEEPANETEDYGSEETEAIEEVAAIEPAIDENEEKETAESGITEEIAAENVAIEESAKDNSSNDGKIIRMPKIIYNDGIPATPVHKKSKFSKPVTKIIVKKAPVKDETLENAPAKEETKKSAYLGKWKTETTEDGKISAKLCASNGGVLLVTPAYTSDIGLKNGIASIKKHLAAGNVTISANKAGKFVFKITAPSGRTIVTSEQYGARFQCEKALESAKRFAESAIIVE